MIYLFLPIISRCVGIMISSKFHVNSLSAVNEIVLTRPLELGQVVGVTGLVLTKLDGSARGGCVVFSSFLFILMIFLNRFWAQ